MPSLTTVATPVVFLEPEVAIIGQDDGWSATFYSANKWTTQLIICKIFSLKMLKTTISQRLSAHSMTRISWDEAFGYSCHLISWQKSKSGQITKKIQILAAECYLLLVPRFPAWSWWWSWALPPSLFQNHPRWMTRSPQLDTLWSASFSVLESRSGARPAHPPNWNREKVFRKKTKTQTPKLRRLRNWRNHS